MLFGRPLKHIRHADEVTHTLEPQRFVVHTFWKYQDNGTTRTDGLDLKDEQKAPHGSIVTKHKMEILVTPETIEPQQIYMGRLKLSFNDIFSHAICGGRFTQGSYLDTSTENFLTKTNPITPQLFPVTSATDVITAVSGDGVVNKEIGNAGSGFGIQEWMLDDHIKKYINTKKITVFDQRPLMGERWQRIPSKVKRINEGTFYGLFIFNDSPRGGTPADTQVKINIKSYWEELAI